MTYTVTLTFQVESSMLDEEDDNPGALQEWIDDDPVAFVEQYETEMVSATVKHD